MSETPSKLPTGRAADGSTYTVGDDVLIRAKVIDISDAFMEITIATVRIPERLGGVGFVSLEQGIIQSRVP